MKRALGITAWIVVANASCFWALSLVSECPQASCAWSVALVAATCMANQLREP